jgi:hypothetical protein
MPNNDTLSKLRELVRIAEKRSFFDANSMAEYEHDLALGSESNPFRNIATNEPSSHVTVRRHVLFAHGLRLVVFHDPKGFLSYTPLRLGRDALDQRIGAELWAFLEREGVTQGILRKAMKGLSVTDASSIWKRLDKRNISHEDFRKCLHLLSQVSHRLRANRRKTYHLDAVD